MTELAPIVHCDWLQLNVTTEVTINFKYHGFYKVKLMTHSTRHFKIVEEIYHHNKRIATVTRQPLSNIIKANTALIKFDNWLLYSFDLYAYAKNFIALNQMIFQNISRLDICCDFQAFEDNMHPSKFIKSYLYGKYLRLGRTTAGTSYFQQKKNEINFNSLKFGSNLSEVSCYLYNKTVEMSTIKWKPWIAKKWFDENFPTNIDTWRLEVSLKSSAKFLVDKSTGETEELNNLEILKHENILKLFVCLREKYFSFVIKDTQIKKSRMKKLTLFKNEFSQFMIFDNSNSIASNRSDKIFIKKLEQVNQDLRGQNLSFNIDINCIKQQYIEITGLHNWAVYKGLLN